MKENFSYQGQVFELSFKNSQFSLYKSSDDNYYSWWDEEPQKRVKNPIRLVRQIWQVTRKFIYKHKITYFEIFVSDPKRSRIYRKFLNTLSGYQYFEYGYSFAVVKMKGDT